jgi:hypothetical protein
MNKIRRQANQLYMQLKSGKMFDAYHDLMYEMLDELEYAEDDEIEEAKIILEQFKAIIKAQEILLANKL